MKEKLLVVWGVVKRLVKAVLAALKVAFIESVKVFLATMKKESEL